MYNAEKQINMYNSLKVIFEDNHLLIVDKPAGVLTQGDKTGDVTMLELGKAFIKNKYDKPGQVFLGLVHRLDRPVGGCLILAKTSKCLARMNKAFAEGAVKKQYIALVSQITTESSGTLVNYLLKDAKKNETKVVTKQKTGAKLAKLKYRIAARISPYYLLEIIPYTGRSHQIRVQLSAMGSPIAGDHKYGGKTISDSNAIALHCHALQFLHPVRKKPMTVHSKPPQTTYWKPFIPILPLPFESW